MRDIIYHFIIGTCYPEVFHGEEYIRTGFDNVKIQDGRQTGSAAHFLANVNENDWFSAHIANL